MAVGKGLDTKLSTLNFDKVHFTRRTNGTLSVAVRGDVNREDWDWWHGDIQPEELEKLRGFLND